MRYYFTVDDNIRFLKETARCGYASLFDHPYAAMWKQLHDLFGVKVQLNLFYRDEEFTLAQMPDHYRKEWAANADWLKLSFHSDHENECPYEHAAYDEVYADCHRVQDEILRFAGVASLAETTTVHYCQTTADGLHALRDSGVKGLLGLYGTSIAPMTSYSVPSALAQRIRNGEIVTHNGVAMAAIDIIINTLPREALLPALETIRSHKRIRVMIHEQYFYEDYPAYQADFMQKLTDVFTWFEENGYCSAFFEEDV